jgi:hypothetical protein
MKIFYSFITLLLLHLSTFAQSTLITPGTNEPNIIANVTNYGGITPPRLTAQQIAAIASPTVGSMVYDSDNNCLRIFDGSKWKCQTEAIVNPDAAAHSVGGLGNQIPYDMEIVGEFIYVAGEFENTINFVDDFGPVILTSSGGKDGFVAKLRKDGRVIWARQMSNSSQCIANQVKIDNNGDVYVGGTHKGTMTVGSITLGNASTSTNDIFFAKYNTNGVFQWVQKIGGTDEDSLSAMAIDGQNNIHLTGMFAGTTTLYNAGGGIGVILFSAGCTDLLYAKYSNAGAYVHHKVGTSAACVTGTALTIDQFNNVYLAGTYRGTTSPLTFDGIPYNPPTEIDKAGFFVKISASNVTISTVKSAGVSWPSAMVTDNSNNLYLVSNYRLVAGSSFIGTLLIPIPLLYVAKFSNSLDLVWFNTAVNVPTNSTIGSSCLSPGGSIYLPKIADISISNNSTLHVTGVYFCATAFNTFGINSITGDYNYGNDPRIYQTAQDFNAAYFEYDLDGNLRLSKSYGAITGFDGFTSIKAASNGEVFGVGFFENTVNWGNGYTTTSIGEKDMFLLKLSK